MRFELTAETKTWMGRKVFRLKALLDFGNVKKGELGGWVESVDNLQSDGEAWVCGEALVCGEAWVCGEALVCGEARVYDKAWVCGEALVCGEARVCGEALVCGEARVYDKALVCGEARVYDKALVCGEALVYDKALVCGEARVYDKALVCGEARVCGEALVCGEARVYDKAWVCGEALVCGEAWVCGEALVCGEARVYDKAWVCGANPRVAKHDIWGVLIKNTAEIPFLLKALNEGKINGSIYKGSCACLMGTIANAKKCDVFSLERDPDSPAEKWFMQISEGQTPENSEVVKTTVKWIEEFLLLSGLNKAA